MTQTITAYFDTRSEAMAAQDRLAGAGIPRPDIKVAGADEAAATAAAEGHHRGFWAALGAVFMPAEDRSAYEEGVRRGGSILTVRTQSPAFDRISDILEEAGAVDLDARESQWRAEGWSGHEAGRDASTAGTERATTGGYVLSDATGTTDLAESAARVTPEPAPARASDAAALRESDRLAASDRTGTTARIDGAAQAGGTERAGTIEVVEETLRVGKRDVSHGRVRVRSYVVSDAVSEDVSLREERVDIARRPVDRPAGAGEALFQDRTIEMEETGQEAVVSKDARVTGEIGLSRAVEDRVETVSDTLRRTAVEIEDERGGGAIAGTGTGPADRR